MQRFKNFPQGFLAGAGRGAGAVGRGAAFAGGAGTVERRPTGAGICALVVGSAGAACDSPIGRGAGASFVATGVSVEGNGVDPEASSVGIVSFGVIADAADAGPAFPGRGGDVLRMREKIANPPPMPTSRTATPAP